MKNDMLSPRYKLGALCIIIAAAAFFITYGCVQTEFLFKDSEHEIELKTEPKIPADMLPSH